MGSSPRKLSCPKCDDFKTADGKKFLQHIDDTHTIKCPKCLLKGFNTNQELNEHINQIHDNLLTNTNNVPVEPIIKPSRQIELPKPKAISCPKCNKNTFTDGESFVHHLRDLHSFMSEMNIRRDSIPFKKEPAVLNKKLPKIGDRVLAMWEVSRWQYFHATIVAFNDTTLKYEINWDDGDTTGRVVDYFNLAIDRVPESNEIGIGSIVLFPQGGYKAGATQLTGGKRWHQGCITKIYKRNGITLYDGNHTKGQGDGKFVTYYGYEYNFKGKDINHFRVGPNLFDLLGNDNDDHHGDSIDDIDIFFSYDDHDLPSMRKDSEQPLINLLCDPIEIENDLKVKGLSVVDSKKDDKDLKQKVKLMKNSKVFVACISDQYVLNDQCRMEFQYAKATLKKPVVPLVIGDGMEWMMSVVGMLIAGELYIHFKDKTVHSEKCEEVLRSLSRHITTRDGVQVNMNENQNTESHQDDIFISYCWSNSYEAHEQNQINNYCGTKFNDPRMISQQLSTPECSTWLDIERLTSADKNAGLFEQLANALKDSKVFVPFISNEYANSVNCRMEFQFASKSLRKHVIPILVGTGNDWKETVVGLIMTEQSIEPINFQNVDNEETLNLLIQKVKEKISEFVSSEGEEFVKSEKTVTNSKSRAPQPGDHVVCHHFDYCYYMATVIGYNISTMEYTVDWDDGDPSGRVQKYNQVAVDRVPDQADIGVGSIIFFPQGSYGGTEGNNSGGQRYHEGEITHIIKEGTKCFFDGHHTRTAEKDGKACWYREYDYEFKRIPLDQIRVAPSALDVIR